MSARSALVGRETNGGQITPKIHADNTFERDLSGVNKIVILDEATSSLTHSMETRLSGALAEHFRASTVITITHRVSIPVHSARVIWDAAKIFPL